MHIFLNSVSIGILTVLFSLIVGLSLAVLIAKTNIPFRKFISWLYLIPLFIPPSIAAASWINIFGQAQSLYSLLGTVLILGFCYSPFITILAVAGLTTIDKDTEEAARLDYGDWVSLWKIGLPHSLNYILAGSLFVFVFAVSNYEVPSLLGVKTYPIEIMAQFSSFYNFKMAVVYSLPLIALTTVLIVLAARVMEWKDYFTTLDSQRHPHLIKLKTSAKTIGLVFVGLVFGFTIFFPFYVFVSEGARIYILQKVFQTSHSEIFYSIFLGIVSAILVVVFSFVYSYFLTRAKGWRKRMLYYLSILPLALSSSVLGVVIIKIFNRPWLNFVYTTPVILIVGFILRFAPFAIRILTESIKKIDKSIEESAIISGVGLFKRLIFIFTPLSRAGIIASLAIVFALVMGELGLSVLLVPAGYSTLILKIYNLMHYGSSKLVSGLCVVSVFSIMVVLGLLFLMNKKLKKIFVVAVLACSILFSANVFAGENRHLYSTWDVLELDTCASAWLIKNFVDSEAEFRFFGKGELIDEGIAFDTPDANLRRKHNMSTFESVLKEHKLNDPYLDEIAAMIHSLEVDYWQQGQTEEARLLDKKIKETISAGKSCADVFKKTAGIFSSLYESLKSRLE